MLRNEFASRSLLMMPDLKKCIADVAVLPHCCYERKRFVCKYLLQYLVPFKELTHCVNKAKSVTF